MLAETFTQTSLNDNSAKLWRDGYAVLREVATASEIHRHRTAIANAVSRYAPERPRLEERDTYGKAFLQVMNLSKTDEDVNASERE